MCLQGVQRDANHILGWPDLEGVLTHDDTTTEDGVATRVLYDGRDKWDDLSGMVVDFAESIVHGRPPVTPLEHALVVQRITDAIYESARTGQAVEPEK